MKLFRTILFWLHLASGVAAGLIILLMSVTGVLLTYEKQIIARADTSTYSIATSGPRLPMETLIARVSEQQGAAPSSVTLRAEESAPVAMSFGREKMLFVHPQTAQVLGEGAVGLRGFFGSVTNWHRWIGREGSGREVGKAITGACNVAFLFLVISGLYLWWPRNRSRASWRNILWFRRGLSPKARDFNWHNTIGFWSLAPLFIITLSGVVISYPWASALVFQAVGEKPPTRRGPPGGGSERGERGGSEGGGGEREGGGERGGSERGVKVEAATLAGLDGAWAKAQLQVPGWTSITMQMPSGSQADAPIEFAIDSGSGGQPQHKSTLSLKRSGEVEKFESFGDQSPGSRLRAFFRFAHTGEFGGLLGQTTAGLASLGGVILVWTGLALAWRRLLAARARRTRSSRASNA